MNKDVGKDLRNAVSLLAGLVYGAAQTAPTVSYAVLFAVGKYLIIDGIVPYANLLM